MSRSLPLLQTVTLVLVFVHTNFISKVSAHAILDEPNPRGGLRSKHSTVIVDPKAPIDYSLHFPAGDKAQQPGSGKRSQEKAGGNNWVPFEPLKRGFRWRAGVCGDLVNGGEHLKGGKYYYPKDEALIVKKYKPGDLIDASVKIVAHHNGFMEMHLCDITKCSGGDISEDCFNQGYCIQLSRARNKICDDGTSKECAPIDPNYPGRWYLPCSKNNNDGVWERFGPSTMLFQIPKSFSCEHCVLQWFYTGANSCNPPGVIEYFDSPEAPKNWGSCPGQGGAKGGVSRVQRPCGGTKFPEEYLLCADISVTGSTVAEDEGNTTPLAAPSESASAVSSEAVSATPSESAIPSVSALSEPSNSAVPAPSESPKPILTVSASSEPSESAAPSPSEMSVSRPSVSSSPDISASAAQSPSETPAAGRRVRASSKPSTPKDPSPIETPASEHSFMPTPEATSLPSPTMKPTLTPTPSIMEAPEAPSNPKASPEAEQDSTEAGVLTKLKENKAGSQMYLDVTGLSVVSAGKVLGPLYNGDVVVGNTLPKLTFEAITTRNVKKVRFEIRVEGKRWVSIATKRPFRMFQDSDPPYWDEVVLDEKIRMFVSTKRDTDRFSVTFVGDV